MILPGKFCDATMIVADSDQTYDGSAHNTRITVRLYAMMRELPEGIAIVVIGPSGAALGRRLRAALPEFRIARPARPARGLG